MKNLNSMLAVCLLLMPAIIHAQDEYKYQPIPNKAEYYVDKFKPGKDFEDLLKWGEDLVKWTSKHSIYDNWQPVLFMPYFNSNSQSLDSVFLGIWPNATEQYIGLIIGSKMVVNFLKKYQQFQFKQLILGNGQFHLQKVIWKLERLGFQIAR